MSDIIKCETESKTFNAVVAIVKTDITSTLCQEWSDLNDIGRLMQISKW